MRRLLRILTATVLGCLCVLLVLVSVFFFRLEVAVYLRRQCPVATWFKPISRAQIKSDDFVEYRTSAPEDDRITRIYADGRVFRDTSFVVRSERFGCPLRESDKTTHIDAKAARALVASVRAKGFCRFCQDYEPSGRVFDAGRASVKLQVDGGEYEVSEYAEAGPSKLHDVEALISESLPPLPDYVLHPDEKRTAECRRIW